jgi:hypothetical protein
MDSRLCSLGTFSLWRTSLRPQSAPGGAIGCTGVDQPRVRELSVSVDVGGKVCVNEQVDVGGVTRQCGWGGVSTLVKVWMWLGATYVDFTLFTLLKLRLDLSGTNSRHVWGRNSELCGEMRRVRESMLSCL